MIKVPQKMKDRKEYGNFRNVSLMAHVGKILLKIATTKVDAYCEAKGLLPEE